LTTAGPPGALRALGVQCNLRGNHAAFLRRSFGHLSSLARRRPVSRGAFMSHSRFRPTRVGHDSPDLRKRSIRTPAVLCATTTWSHAIRERQIAVGLGTRWRLCRVPMSTQFQTGKVRRAANLQQSLIAQPSSLLGGTSAGGSGRPACRKVPRHELPLDHEHLGAREQRLLPHLLVVVLQHSHHYGAHALGVQDAAEGTRGTIGGMQ